MKKKFICIVICILQLCLLLPVSAMGASAPKTLFLSQAQNLALSSSKEITKQTNKIIIKQMKYVEAVDGIKAKIKNLKSFRWTPLLSFKFPEKLNMTDEFDLNIKPSILQSEVNTLKNELDKMKYTILCDLNRSFTEVFICQEKIAFDQERLDYALEQLERNKANLVTGGASQSDIDVMQKKVENLTESVSLQKRSFESAKKDLTNKIKLDVSSGYVFKNPLLTADITRDYLPWLVEYTLNNNHSLYEARVAESKALISINAYESLMKGQYGNKMNGIQIFISQAKNGADIDYAAFQIEYMSMLKKLDKPWAGKIKILFFKFSKEWTKGEISGTRYIEDEIYAVYTACMEYVATKKERETIEKSLTKEVESTFESIVTTKNAFNSSNKQLISTRKDLDKLVQLNRLGKATFDEVNDKQELYQELQLDTLEALSVYNDFLFEFDKLSCGAITKLFKGEGVAFETGEGGDGYSDIESIDKPYYYIYTDISDLVFVFGLDIPNDFEPELSDYEIWYEDVQIGERTAISKSIRHLALDYGETSMLTVKLFNNGKYIDECDVDTTAPRDILKLKSEKPKPKATTQRVASYSVETVTYDNFSSSELDIIPDEGLGIKYYSLESQDGLKIFTNEMLPVTSKFSYLTLLIASLDKVSIIFYDRSKEELYRAKFDTSSQTIIAPMTTES